MKGLPLTWKQVEPGLPPEELAGSVDATSIAAPNLRRYLEDPPRSIKPRAAWPSRLRRTRVRAEPTAWQEILVGLYQRQIVTFLTDDELIYWCGEALLNGAFGVPKLEEGQVNFDPLQVTLRLIVNLQPSNELQEMIVALLPVGPLRAAAARSVPPLCRGPARGLLPVWAASCLVALVRPSDGGVGLDVAVPGRGAGAPLASTEGDPDGVVECDRPHAALGSSSLPAFERAAAG